MNFQATDEQLNIITATEGYQRCASVPGSGKTRVLTDRIAYLIKDLYIDPASIYALTFTNKAASEMKKRLKKMIGDDADCFTGTFHGLCNKILKEESYKLAWPKTFVILDKKDQGNLIREIAAELSFSMTDLTVRECLDKLSEIKNTDKSYIELIVEVPREALLDRIKEETDEIYLLIYHYFLRQRDNYLVDFNDLIQFTLYIFDRHPDIKKKWQDGCMYVLCDEFQDVSDSQMRLLDILSDEFKNLFVVGDDDQLIYGWRAAKPEYMLNFVSSHKDCKDFYLSENFRSTPEIVAAANSLIEKNKHRIKKTMRTNNPPGDKPTYYHAKSEKAEALWIAGKISSAVKEGKMYSEHAVLVRASSQTRALEEAFVTKGIPYRIYSGAMFYATEEIKTTLSYLRMIYSLNDHDFVQTINRPRRQFGKKSLAKLKEYAGEKHLSLILALGEQIKLGMIKKKPLVGYYNSIMKLHEIYKDFSSKALVNMVLDIGYREELEEDVDQTRLNNVTELITTIAALEAENGEPIALEDLLAHFALFTNQDEADDAKNIVKIMTIHTAKGLEFDTVFVNGLVENQFPSGRLKNQDEMEEERRLFYVAMTRAKKCLYLSSYATKTEFHACVPSRFIGDIATKLLHFTGEAYVNLAYGNQSALPKKLFSVGDKVFHKVFGNGEIVGVNEKEQVYEIKFDIMPTVRRIQFRAELDGV